MAWTFPDDVAQEDIEACLELMKVWGDQELPEGFIGGIIFAIHYHGDDGGEYWRYRTITGQSRLTTLIGLLELCKINLTEPREE